MEEGRDVSPGGSAQVMAGLWDAPPPGLVEFLIRDDNFVSTLRMVNSKWCRVVDGAVWRIVLFKGSPSADIENSVMALLTKLPRVHTIECNRTDALRPLADHFAGKVVHLETYGREAHDWETLARFGKLETLAVKGRCSHGDFAHFSTMTTLRDLELSHYQRGLDNTDVLRCLTNLEKLVLDHCEIEPLQFVETLTGLVDLCISYNIAWGLDYGVVSALTNLTSLDLIAAQFADGDASFLSGLANLKKLELDHTSIGDGGFHHVSHLTKLTHLSLGYVEVTEMGLAPIAYLRGLEYLCIGSSKMTFQRGLFLVQLANLRVLHVTGQVQSEVMESIATLKLLTDLTLDVMLIANNAFSLIANLQHLEALCLSNDRNPNVAGFLSEWGCLHQLICLGLWGNGWVDESLVNLSRLEKMEELTISSDSITDGGMQHVLKLYKLENLTCFCASVSRECKDKLIERFPGSEMWIV